MPTQREEARLHLVEANNRLVLARRALRNDAKRHDYADAALILTTGAQQIVAALEGDLTPLSSEDRKGGQSWRIR